MRARSEALESDRFAFVRGSTSSGVTYDASTCFVEVANANAMTRFIVLDCQVEVTITDVVIPIAPQFAQLTIDTWNMSETIDAQRLILAHPISTEPLVLGGLRVRARFIKIAVISPHSIHTGTIFVGGIKGRYDRSTDLARLGVLDAWEKKLWTATNIYNESRSMLLSAVSDASTDGTRRTGLIGRLYRRCAEANAVATEARVSLLRAPGVSFGRISMLHVHNEYTTERNWSDQSSNWFHHTAQSLAAVLKLCCPTYPPHEAKIAGPDNVREMFFALCVEGVDAYRTTLGQMLLLHFTDPDDMPSIIEWIGKMIREYEGYKHKHIRDVVVNALTEFDTMKSVLPAVVGRLTVCAVSCLQDTGSGTSGIESFLAWTVDLLKELVKNSPHDVVGSPPALKDICSVLTETFSRDGGCTHPRALKVMCNLSL